MSYTPINWQTGQTITAEKLNRCDNGWSVSTVFTTLFEDTVTTSETGEAALEGAIDFNNNSNITVTFSGTTYNLTGFDDAGYWTWGAPYQDYSVYPFSIYYDNNFPFLMVQTPGTYSIKIEGDGEVVETSTNFAKAVGSVIPETPTTDNAPMYCESGVTTYDEMNGAQDERKILYFYADSSYYFITYVAYNQIGFIPSSEIVTASFVNDIFTVTVS